MAKTFGSWNRVRDREALDGHVRRIMVNTRTSWWRRRRVDERLAERPDRDLTTDLDLHDARWSALATLPNKPRTTVVLRYCQDLSEAKTAGGLGVPVGTMKSTTLRALTTPRAKPA